MVEGDFTPLLSRDACLDSEVMKFMNLHLLDIATHKKDEDLAIFETYSESKDYQNCFSEKPGKLPNDVHLEIDPSVTLVVHAPRKIPIASLDPGTWKLMV